MVRLGLGIAAGFLAGVLLVAILGGAKPARTATVTVTTPGGGTTAVITKVRVPDVTGKQLDLASDDLANRGFRAEAEGGGTFGVLIESNWTVTGQDPAAGTLADQGDTIRLSIER